MKIFLDIRRLQLFNIE